MILVWFEGRPWLVDCLDEWVKRIEEGPCHKCCAIFVDNSGLDAVLGIIPFARELIRNGTEVKICFSNYAFQCSRN